MNRFHPACLLALAMLALPPGLAAEPRLLLTGEDIRQIHAQETLPTAFEAAIARAEERVAPYLTELPDIPVPRDPGGGYTHEQHKRNATLIHEAGVLSQLTGNQDYARLATEMLLEYAKLYPTLGLHPAMKKTQSAGRLFWQSLNEAVWLVYAIQGFDAIRDGLSEQDREAIETGLFLPLASFISVESPQTFDRVHNHGTWAVAAVGMTGYVLQNDTMVEQALYGLDRKGNSGFMKQLDELFSPDGYYNEGPYYQRYALMPFALFARVIDENDPQRKIFAHRDEVLLKAIYSTVNLSYNSYFFPINDAIKDKDLATAELTFALPIAFSKTRDASLLSIVQQQNGLVLTGDAFDMALAMDEGKTEPFNFTSVEYRDGGDGDRGVLSILRRGDSQSGSAMLLKSTSQGQGHGHFDKLNWLFFDNGREIVTDYGAARFLNVEEKNGGRYLPENDSWAKQTIAHNTLVVDETSHFGGDWKQGELHHPTPIAFDPGPGHQVAAALMRDAYPDVTFHRALLSLDTELFQNPIILDVLKVQSPGQHQYDLPLHYQGHLTNTSHAVKANTDGLRPLGTANGYQHLWLGADADISENDTFQLTWLTGNRFYTYSTLATQASTALLTQTGANDPDYNLRWEPGLVWRVKEASQARFVSVLEPHGEYNGSKEFTTRSASQLAALAHFSTGPDGEGAYEVIKISTRSGKELLVALAWNYQSEQSHRVTAFGTTIEWDGFYRVIEP